MYKISSKTGEVAERLLQLNLQLFAEEDAIEDPVEDFDEAVFDLPEEGEQPAEEPPVEAETPEVAEPEQDEKPKQDSETNRAFQEMRKKIEEAEKKAQQLEQKRQQEQAIAREFAEHGIAGIFSDEDVVARFGASHGLKSVDDLRRQVQRELLQRKGYDPDEIEQLIKQNVEKHPDIVAAKEAAKAAEQAAFTAKLQSEYAQLKEEFGDFIKADDGSDITPDVWQKWNDGKNGLTLAEAFAAVNRKQIMQRQAEVAAQAARKNAASKGHIKAEGTSSGSSDVDVTVVPAETLRMYRQMFPKMTDKQFIEHYKKSQGG